MLSVLLVHECCALEAPGLLNLPREPEDGQQDIVDGSKERAILDTFDLLPPTLGFPQTVDEVRRSFETSGLRSVDVAIGNNGVYGRGLKPKGAA